LSVCSHGERWEGRKIKKMVRQIPKRTSKGNKREEGGEKKRRRTGTDASFGNIFGSVAKRTSAGDGHQITTLWGG